MEKSESPLNCAMRELQEETGFVILGNFELITKFKLPDNSGSFYVYTYEMKRKITPNLNKVRDGFEHET
jgi:8-oxo-dGTP pyrophosphatase MutT (NUDIX family)